MESANPDCCLTEPHLNNVQMENANKLTEQTSGNYNRENREPRDQHFDLTVVKRHIPHSLLYAER